jgi:2-polyprenyl-6-methoxyphenol hydroxylase-like FAD-dependent oxidoreductase
VVTSSGLDGLRVAVVGAGPVGAVAALRLARAGADVVVVEPDAPLPDLPDDELTTFARPGAPHCRQAHNLMPLGRALLARGLPDVYAALLAAGASEVDLRRHLPEGPADAEGERDLVGLAARRFLLERVLRRAVDEEPGVTVLPARALDVREGPVLATTAGDVSADLVVDAAGRRSCLPSALASRGAHVLVDAEDCGVTYATRYYRLREPGSPTRLRVGLALRTDLPYANVALFRADGDVFSASFGVPPGDRELRRVLADPVAFDSAASRLPRVDRWLAAADPVGGVVSMGGLRNAVLRTGVLPVSYVAVGDSAGTTNPQLGWGLSLGWQHVEVLLHALVEEDEVPAAAARARATVQAHAVLRCRASAREDRHRNAWWSGRPYAPSPVAALWWAAAEDRALAVAAVRRVGALDLPDAHLELPGAADAVAAARAELAALGPPTEPTREELLRAATRVPAVA